jgi:hypothetical protein
MTSESGHCRPKTQEFSHVVAAIVGDKQSLGRKGGAKLKLSPIRQKETINMMSAGGKTQVEVAELFNVDRSTISRLVSERRVSAA